MITSKQYDELTGLLEKYRAAIDYVHTAVPEAKLDAAYDFAEADKAIEAFILSLVDFDGIAKQTAADADGWIEWGGGECPVKGATLVDIKFRNGDINRGYKPQHLDWRLDGDIGDIIAYRIVK